MQAGLVLQLRVGSVQITCIAAAAAATAATVGTALVSVAVASGGIVVCRRQQNVRAISCLQKLTLDSVRIIS